MFITTKKSLFSRLRFFSFSSEARKRLLFFPFFLGLGLTILCVSRSSFPWISPLQNHFLNLSGTCLEKIHHIKYTVISKIQVLRFSFLENQNLIKEKHHLTQENLELRQKVFALEKIREENKTLKEALHFVQSLEENFLTADVLENPSKSLDKGFLIKAGSLHGIRKGQAVLSMGGVVGRIDQVSQHVARVIPLTHKNSRIPVISLSSRVEGILAGNGTIFPMLTYLQENQPLKNAEILVTSKYGGTFPAGYIVGYLHRDDQGQLKILPFISWGQLESVHVILSSEALEKELLSSKEQPLE